MEVVPIYNKFYTCLAIHRLNKKLMHELEKKEPPKNQNGTAPENGICYYSSEQISIPYHGDDGLP
jgi:hypothetical protein